ncbi:MFS transporter [Streptomyces sp. R11]|uniref:MFS transporter n=1 Tax=Streptomyces sp. R11 TaxID=3238625 RepID=A0AB39MQM5_9ACTN
MPGTTRRNRRRDTPPPRTGSNEIEVLRGFLDYLRTSIAKGRREEAEVLIEKYGIEVDVVAELEERDAPAKEGFGALFHRRHLRSTVFANVFWAALVLPYVAIGTFWTQVLEALNMGDNAVAALLVHSFTAVAGVTAGCLVVDRIGRRRLLIPPFWITAGCLALVALWPTSTPVIVGDSCSSSSSTPLRAH